MKTARYILVACMALLFAGCPSPWQGAGALYVAEKGKINCYEVDSVRFIASRHTTYMIDGQEFIAQKALDFYLGQSCK